MLSCGKIVQPSVEKPDLMMNLADGVDGFRRGVREEVAAKADFIKIYNSGSAFSRSTRTGSPIMEPAEVRKAVETAQANGLYVAAHCHADSAIRDCILCGVRTIEHATYIQPETVDLLDGTRDCYLVPTLAAMFISQTDPAERAAWEKLLNPMLEQCVKGDRPGLPGWERNWASARTARPAVPSMSRGRSSPCGGTCAAWRTWIFCSRLPSTARRSPA